TLPLVRVSPATVSLSELMSNVPPLTVTPAPSEIWSPPVPPRLTVPPLIVSPVPTAWTFPAVLLV
ncbi:MAG: hypothetical protein ACLQIB_03295, partial [Isosphaeraceae bacterium]